MHHCNGCFYSLTGCHLLTINFPLLILLWYLVLHCLLIRDLPDKSDSDDDFDGSLAPEDGLIVYCSTAELKDEATCS